MFVNQPLSFHAQARDAAKAFLAAHQQGKAWEMHDKLFANQQALTPADLEKYAEELGLNMARFKKDMADPATEKMVAEDQALAGSVGADGTPTFFINGREISGAQPFAAFQTIIDEEIKKADELLKAGTKPAEIYDKLMAEAPRPLRLRPPPPPLRRPRPRWTSTWATRPPRGRRPRRSRWWRSRTSSARSARGRCRLLKQIEDNYKGKVRIAFKHLPLRSTRTPSPPPRPRWPPTSRASSGSTTTSCSPISSSSTGPRWRSTPRSWA